MAAEGWERTRDWHTHTASEADLKADRLADNYRRLAGGWVEGRACKKMSQQTRCRASGRREQEV